MSICSSFSLEGKVALVTGGSGKYGRQITKALVEAGARTYISSRRRDQLSAIENEFRSEGCSIRALYMEQEDEASILAMRDEIVSTEGRFDILVNNAVARTMSGWDDSAESFARSMTANATGLFLITRAFGDVMAEQGSGSIINIGSIQGMIGPDGQLYEGLDFHGFVPDYFFHKGGMINFTRFAAAYYGPRQVRCNCISPGGFWTERTPEEFVKRYSARTFLNRMAGESDLMGAVIFLASDASLYITGTNLPVDGGYTAK
ncbi:SDR family oxidoreductase [Paenibacillus aurantius]|uniref:SDR family oxidoreductase n=1 Tax=Paenibacillus aurantius TaxID=2918900 RepID=A0AA96LKT1_9BACL|nr:SDR family oxidoreductase [Paenibacillus aurantius]WNQ13217.1 SDR family oxidoreductase [Paenibacillus aurantius]